MNTPTVSTLQDAQLGTIVHLENGSLVAEIAIECGSNLISLTHNGVELIHTDRAKLLEHAYTGCFVLYPFPNRVRDRAFTFEGVTYSLGEYPKIVNDDALIHGVAHDGMWSIKEAPKVEGNEALVTTLFTWDTSQEYFNVFPLQSELRLTYRLSTSSIHIEYGVTNTGEKRMPFGFALHPSFKRLSGDETTLSLPAQKVMRMDEKLLPTGEVFDLDTVMFRQFDLRNPVPVNSALRLDHVYTDLIQGEHSIIDHPTEGISLHVTASDDCKFIVLHTLGKNRTIEIEPQTCSTDAVNALDPKAAGLQVLEPGASHNGFIKYSIKTK